MRTAGVCRLLRRRTHASGPLNGSLVGTPHARAHNAKTSYTLLTFHPTTALTDRRSFLRGEADHGNGVAA
jgi:hypothetical protein